MALFIVIDRSNSMGFNSRIGTLRDGEKLRYAIQAGMAVVKQLKDHDRVGVIAFDARPHEIAPLRPLKENRRKLLDALPRIVESGGTDFYDALAIAAEQLRRARVSRKHVVLLTDGDTNRAGGDEYRDLIAGLAAAKISVTTIRIGDNTVNLKLLQQISTGTGGSFHHVADAQMLPDLMLRDTSRALRPLAPRSQLFFPALGSKHQLFEQSAEVELPHLRDYAFSKSKPHSETLLHIARSNRQDPLLSVWRYGLGRVAAFTASPRDDAESWPGWAGYARFWSNLAYWTARRESDHDISVRAVRRAGSTELIAESFGRGHTESIISGQLFVDDDFAIDADFVADQQGLYRANLRPLPAGRFPLRLLSRSASGAVREARSIVAIPAQLEDEMEEYRETGNDEDLLRELTSRTGGTLNAPASEILNRPTGSRTVSYPLAKFLVPLAMLAFFIDVALRRIASLASTD